MALPDSSPDNKPSRLPFEPTRSRKKLETKPTPAEERSSSKNRKTQQKVAESSIPEVVSRRMARRMALFCGLPSLMGMMTFVASYAVVSNHWFELPPVVTLGVSLSFFGIGFLGLSYGVLSASWEEEQEGSFIGWPEFQSNWSKMTAAWRSSKQDDS